MSSFKEARELFRLCYKMNYISDDEFLLLYTSYESQNLELPYDSFSEFDFEKVLATTNVWHCLDFKKCTYCNIRCSRGSVCDKEKALCLLLKRTCFTCRYSDMVHLFAKPVPVISMIKNEVLDLSNSRSSYSTMEPSATNTQESRILRRCSSQKGSTTG